jgi:hypothetical protein
VEWNGGLPLRALGAGRSRRLHGAKGTLPAVGGRIGAGFVLFLLAGCAGELPRPADPAAATTSILELGAALPSAGWTGRGKIDWLIDGRRGHGRVRMLLADSERVRVDIEPRGAFGLGGGRATLWADGTQVLWAEGNEPPRLVDADAIFAPILGGRATGTDLALLLLGLARLGARWPPPPWQVAPGEEPALVATLAEGAAERAMIAGPPLVLTSLERRDSKGKLQFRARFSDFELTQEAKLARQLDLEAPGQGNKLQVQWEAIDRGEVTGAELGWPAGAAMQ